MKKTLETTVQNIVPERQETSQAFSDFISLEPDAETLALQHGNLYVVYDFSTQNPVDTSLVNKFVSDVLHNTYYTSQSASPIHPLEKAALEIKEKLSQFAQENNNTDIDFNIAMAVVWGEVLYIVSYGKNALFIRRDSELREIETVSEGNFAIASGLVKDMDVVFLSTHYFTQQYAPERIFKSTTPILQSQLGAQSAAVILKFNVVTEFSQDETVEIINPSAPLNIKKESDKKTYKLKKSLLKLHTGQTSKKKKLLVLLVFVALCVVFAASVYAVSKSNKEARQEKNVQTLIDRAKKLLSKDELSNTEKKELKETQEKIINEASESSDVKGVSSKIAEALNLKSVDSSLFYDLALVDKKATIRQIVFAGDALFVADPSAGALYKSALTTSKFTKVAGSYLGIKNLGVEYSEDNEANAANLSFTTTSGYQTLDLATLKTAQEYPMQNPGLVFPYLGFVYEIKNGGITKHTKSSGNRLTNVSWATDSDLSEAVAFTIDSSIYVLMKNGFINKYTSGTKDTFELSGFDVNLFNPSQLYTTADFKNMYILDTGNKRVVVIDKNGKFLSQYMDSDDKWTDLRGLTVSADEKTLYVLSGNKVFEVEL
jgi:cytoskeletal protein RodZ